MDGSCLLAVGGLGWLGVLAALGYFQMPVPEIPRTEGWPVPTLMVACGVVLGIVLALAAIMAGAAAARGRAAAGKRLKAAVAAVAGRLVVEPVEVEIAGLGPSTRALKYRRAGTSGLPASAVASLTLIRVRRFRVVVWPCSGVWMRVC